VGQLPRILAIIGSGELTPSMAPLHRALLSRFGEGPVPATLLDTPYGFQENAADITAAAVGYFAKRLRNPISVASFRRSTGDILERQNALARVRQAAYVFSGPGSPSYALRNWTGTEIPGLLADKLASGGALVMASAAALTLGRLTVPVYEIYKVGEEPRWLRGLDLLSAFGLPVAVIPHFDNTEGRGHDTRFAFMGDRRLRQLEAEIPDDTFVLGIDEHTSLVFDLGIGRASVGGRRGVTVRREGRSVVFGAGSEVTIEELRRAAFGKKRSTRRAPGPEATASSRGVRAAAGTGTALRSTVAESERSFDDALHRHDLPAAVRSLLALVDLAADRVGSEPDREHVEARRTLRSLIVRLAEATEAADERAQLVGPLTDALVEVRRAARSDRDWAAADAIRDSLEALGVELHDSADGTSWGFREPSTEEG
jgi:hypothetical protein